MIKFNKQTYIKREKTGEYHPYLVRYVTFFDKINLEISCFRLFGFEQEPYMDWDCEGTTTSKSFSKAVIDAYWKCEEDGRGNVEWIKYP